jgi:hypothetical protein
MSVLCLFSNKFYAIITKAKQDFFLILLNGILKQEHEKFSNIGSILHLRGTTLKFEIKTILDVSQMNRRRITT